MMLDASPRRKQQMIEVEDFVTAGAWFRDPLSETHVFTISDIAVVGSKVHMQWSHPDDGYTGIVVSDIDRGLMWTDTEGFQASFTIHKTLEEALS